MSLSSNPYTPQIKRMAPMFQKDCLVFCKCGAAAGTQHAADCPYPLFTRDRLEVATWERAKFSLSVVRTNTEELRKKLENGKVKK